MISFFGNKTLIKSDDIKAILNDFITPSFIEYGFRYNEDYLWYTDSINEIRKIVKYQRLKGETGIIEWGVCLDFVPSISGSSLKWNRTEKSMTLQLFDWPKDYMNSFFGGGMNYSCASHWGEKEFRKTLKKHFDKNKDNIFDWFARTNNIDGLIKTAKYQIETNGYSMHYPNPKYVLMFLYTKNNQINEALSILDSLDIDWLAKEKILKMIKK
jgi:hypothetical protein